MRLHFQERPWDLYSCIGYTIAIGTALLVLNVGNPLAVLAILFVPGYVLVAALFPGQGGFDWIERIALSLALSLAVVPLLGLLLNFTPWGVQFTPVVAATTIFAILVGYLASWRRMRLPVERRLSATLNISRPTLQEYSGFEKGLAVALGSTIVIAAGTLAYIVTTQRHQETFTEFYILGPSGNASGYPTILRVSQPGSVIAAIANHELISTNYTVRIDLVGVRIINNATSGLNETVEVNRTSLSRFDVTLADRQNWTQPYTFWINATGLWKLQFFLFRAESFSSPYREIHLYISVS